MGRCTPKSPRSWFATAGYTPLEAISACTKENAYAVGLENQVGVVEAGKLADLIILKKNPAADIRVLQDSANLAVIIRDGKRVKLDDQSVDETQLTFQEAVA